MKEQNGSVLNSIALFEGEQCICYTGSVSSPSTYITKTSIQKKIKKCNFFCFDLRLHAHRV